MKTFLYAAILSVILALGGTIAVADPINIPTCPPEEAYVLSDGQYWLISPGVISKYYNKLTTEELEKKSKDNYVDLTQCPPANGHLSSSNGGYLNLPMGFFDDEDNWLNNKEYEAQNQ